MLRLAITVRDPALRISRDVTVQMEESKPASSLIAYLLAHLEWPVEYLNGRPIAYQARIERTGRVLSGKESMSRSGILDADILILAPVADHAFDTGPARASQKSGASSVAVSADHSSSMSDGKETVLADGIDDVMPALPGASLRIKGTDGSLGKALAITDAETILGRGEECDFQVDDRAVSRRHARIRYVAPDFWLEDLGSANGTQLEGHTISRDRLRDGATVTLGTTRVLFNRR